MNAQIKNQTTGTVPEIVRIVLSQADKQRRAGLITDALFEQQIRRIAAEELQPRQLTLLVRELADGRTRFLIKRAESGQVCEMFEPAPLASAA